jgi:hypothetical protein
MSDLNNNHFKNILSSAFGTLIAEIVTIPICTLKTVYQNNFQFTIQQTFTHIYNQNKSYRGFFQASGPSIISQIISTSSKYSAYEYIKSVRGNSEKGDIVNNSINGIIGGLMGSIITHPFDLWKNFVQRNESYIHHLRFNSIYKDRFITRGLYQGYSGSLAKNIVLYASLFPLLDFYESKTDHFWLASVATTVSVSLIIQPFDYYKVVKMSGIKSIQNPMRGFTLLLSRSIPHLFITMSITKYFQNKNK